MLLFHFIEVSYSESNCYTERKGAKGGDTVQAVFWPLEKTLEERSGSAGPSWAGFVHLTTALRREPCEKIRRGKECMQAFPKFLIASPSFHGGRGALPSAGGHPADLTYLAGGGC
ncbi:hypothetical protein ES319_D05G113400v1 [Gossypium barbadense]|uniref:Uncharacterized protein n=2 Tax=Gossypium TaxID=3633 RepID=A0A5J5RJ23_GOSBA|nr:hypothetical protein ES319_D05G113400v1 [Gossypium barbadense]TYG67993.1 hypothetical protein ES288_D05G119200v1 [Gossypium darwinii]